MDEIKQRIPNDVPFGVDDLSSLSFGNILAQYEIHETMLMISKKKKKTRAHK